MSCFLNSSSVDRFRTAAPCPRKVFFAASAAPQTLYPTRSSPNLAAVNSRRVAEGHAASASSLPS